MESFRDIFTPQAFCYFSATLWGLMRLSGPITVSRLIFASDLPGHFSNFYYFFSRATWCRAQVAQSLLDLLFRILITAPPDGTTQRLALVIDDTPNSKRHAPKMESCSWHRSHTAKPGEKQGERGHCWVVLGLLLRHVSSRWLCFALKASLYVREVDCSKTDRPFKTKLELALELARSLKFPAWAQLLLIGDAAYGNQTLGNEPDIDLLSRLRRNAVFFDPPPPKTGKRGRPRKFGLHHKAVEWAETAIQGIYEVNRYGETTTIRIAETTGYLRGIKRPVRILAIWDREEKPFFLFTTDLTLSVVEILEYYAARFEEEVTFRDLKQEVGFGEYRLRRERSFSNYLQLTLVAHALLRLTSIQKGVMPVTTPWYHPTGIPSIAQTKAMLRRGEEQHRFFAILGRMGLPEEIHRTIADQWKEAA